MKNDLCKKTAHELSSLLKKGEISSVEIVDSVFSRIEAAEDKVKAFVSLNRDRAIEAARAADKLIKSGDNTDPLCGIPVAIKDNMCTRGIATTCSSKILANYLPPYNAEVVDRLSAIGVPFPGKTNLDEFAMGSSTENSGFHSTRNPWDLKAVPGGSSGGSAAAVAADETIAALGSDTGGSIRQPAAFCGVVGLKPTYGRVSRYGLVAFASSLDQIGPITKDVTDAALIMNAIAGYDAKDSTSVNVPVPDYRSVLVNNAKKFRIGIISELVGKGIDEDVKNAVKEAARVLEKLGAIVEEVSLPTFEYACPTYYIIAPAEASSNLARYDGVKFGHRSKEAPDLLTMYYNTRREGCGAEVKRRIMIGTYVLSAGYYDAYYLKALKARTLIKNDFNKAFERFDALISPTAPSVAFKAGEKVSDPLAMYLSDIATIPINLAGVPAISLPCGFSNGLPVGLQMIGEAFAEEKLFQLAYTYEQNTEWHKRKPSL